MLKQEYKNIYKQKNSFRKKLIAGLQQYSDEIINKKPAPDKWSIADVIAHYIAGEQYVFDYLERKLNDGSVAKNTGWLAQSKFNILKIAFALPIKFEVPKSVAPIIGYSTLKELEKKWIEASTNAYNLVYGLDESEFHKDIWKHPRVGKINFVQMIDFSLAHNQRHAKQIKEILKVIG